MRKAKQPEYQYRVQEFGFGKKVITFARAEAADSYAVAMSLNNNDGGVGQAVTIRQFKRTARGWRTSQVIEVRATIIV